MGCLSLPRGYIHVYVNPVLSYIVFSKTGYNTNSKLHVEYPCIKVINVCLMCLGHMTNMAAWSFDYFLHWGKHIQVIIFYLSYIVFSKTGYNTNSKLHMEYPCIKGINVCLMCLGHMNNLAAWSFDYFLLWDQNAYDLKYGR